jgi:hypothetical protein
VECLLFDISGGSWDQIRHFLNVFKH